MKQLARDFAYAAHQNQMYGDDPYSVHLDAVVKILEPYGEEVQILGYLHDTVEDTDVTLEIIESTFGEFYRTAVYYITDEPGTSRFARKRKTNRKLAAIPEHYNIVRVVKAADRLANVRTSVLTNSGMLERYKKEHANFVAAVYRPGLCDEIFDELHKLLK